MAELKARLQGDLSAAMKSRDELTTATLRMALTAITNEEVAGKTARELSDDDVLKLLLREAKTGREAARGRGHGGAGRDDPGLRDPAAHTNGGCRGRVGALGAVVADRLERLRARAVEVLGGVQPGHLETVVDQRAARVGQAHPLDV